MNNVVIRGLSGKLGQLVILSDGHLRTRPDVSKRVWSERQREHLSRFEQAKAYARTVMADPALHAKYAAKAARSHGLGVWQLAIADFFHPPRILSVMPDPNCGEQGSRVVIRAVDDFQVAGAEVTIGSDTGLLEQGAAAVDPATGSWVYTLAGDLPRGVDIRITVTVADLPGNRTEKTVSCVF